MQDVCSYFQFLFAATHSSILLTLWQFFRIASLSAITTCHVFWYTHFTSHVYLFRCLQLGPLHLKLCQLFLAGLLRCLIAFRMSSRRHPRMQSMATGSTWVGPLPMANNNCTRCHRLPRIAQEATRHLPPTQSCHLLSGPSNICTRQQTATTIIQSRNCHKPIMPQFLYSWHYRLCFRQWNFRGRTILRLGGTYAVSKSSNPFLLLIQS